MQKFFSKTINRWFYIDPIKTDPIEGLPCFSHKEMAALKLRRVEPIELAFIFDAKVELGVSVEKLLAHKSATSTALVKPNSPEDLGYTKPTPLDVANFAKRIKETIQATQIKAKGFTK